MARLIAGIAEKHKLTPRPIIVVNKSGGAGAEGFLHVKGKKGDAHTIIITLSNLFTTPLHTGVPFNWKELTPVARMALDEFILWVNAETPYKTAKEYLAAVKEKGGTMKMGGTGSAQEDQIITILLEQSQGVKFTYVPFKGGGEVCVNLVGKHVDSTVNNPAECVSHWKAGRVRPLAVFDSARISDPDWKDIPTVKEAIGADIAYLMLRGIFGAPDMPKDAVEWYQGFLKKVYDTPEFKDYLSKGALKPSWLTGAGLRQVARGGGADPSRPHEQGRTAEVGRPAREPGRGRAPDAADAEGHAHRRPRDRAGIDGRGRARPRGRVAAGGRLGHGRAPERILSVLARRPAPGLLRWRSPSRPGATERASRSCAATAWARCSRCCCRPPRWWWPPSSSASTWPSRCTWRCTCAGSGDIPGSRSPS